MGTKNNPGEFDCYVKAEPDEPMFILLGRDKHAPTLVWLWASLRELDGEDANKVTEARNCVAEMIGWAHDHNRKSAGVGLAALCECYGAYPIRQCRNKTPRYRCKEPANR